MYVGNKCKRQGITQFLFQNVTQLCQIDIFNCLFYVKIKLMIPYSEILFFQNCFSRPYLENGHIFSRKMKISIAAS